MAGAWTLTDTEDGVKVSLSVDFEFGIPMIAGMLNPLLKRKVRENCANMLQGVQKQIES
jgi:coenzyme Q-binding protein COQ10